MTKPLMTEPLSAGIGAFGNIAAGLISNAVSASTNKKMMKLQAALNYYYARKTAENSPTWNRKGLESAGYNPMLAVQNATSGANSSWSGLNSVENPQLSEAMSQGISNAQSFQRLENETKTAESTVNLQNEQATTEQSKRKNLEFQNSMLDVEKHLKQKDLDTYDKRFYTEMYRMMQESEKLRQEASVVGYNAESQRIIANAQQQNADVNKQWTPAKIGSGLLLGLGAGSVGLLGKGSNLFKGVKSAYQLKKIGKYKKLHNSADYYKDFSTLVH